MHTRCEFLNDTYYLWRGIRSNRTCLFCICRPPEHLLACGHSICDTCLKILGEEISEYEYYFNVSICPLCGDSVCLSGKVRPPTAGIRVLTIDGGGICGVIPLEFLQLLQRLLGPSIPIQDCFDMVVGTSSGKLSLSITGFALIIFRRPNSFGPISTRLGCENPCPNVHRTGSEAIPQR